MFSSKSRQQTSPLPPDRLLEMGRVPPTNAMFAVKELRSSLFLRPSATKPVTRARAAYSGRLQPKPSMMGRFVRCHCLLSFLSCPGSAVNLPLPIAFPLATALFVWSDSVTVTCRGPQLIGPLPNGGDDGDTGQDIITLQYDNSRGRITTDATRMIKQRMSS